MSAFKDVINEEKQKAKLLYDKDQKMLQKFESLAVKEFQKILIKLSSVTEGKIFKEAKAAIKQESEFVKFVNTISMKGEENYVAHVIAQVNVKGRKADEATYELAREALKKKIDVFLQKGRPKTTIFPEKFYDFLPPTITFEFDAAGMLKGYVQHFVNETESLRAKSIRMANLIKKRNKIVRELKKDLRSGSEEVKLKALMAMIIARTGLRPAREGNKVKVRLPDGTKIETETFGVTTLEKRHVNFIKKTVAHIEFVGKKGIVNVAEVSDKEIVKILKGLTKGKGAKDKIFVTKGGRKITYYNMKDYMDKFEGLTMTDFRRITATEKAFEVLKDKAKEMYVNISSLVATKKRSVKDEVENMVYTLLGDAIEEARKKLNHVEARTTLEYYLNPEIVLRFLSDAKLDENIQTALSKGLGFKVQFNPEDFIRAAMMKKAAPAITITLISSSAEGVAEVKGQLADLHQSIEFS